MLHIEFEYADAISHWEWRQQECVTNSIDSFKRFYELDEPDVKYRIISVKEI